MYITSFPRENGSPDASIDRANRFAHTWWLVAGRGAMAVLFGLLAVLSPSVAPGKLFAICGVYLLADGLLAIIASLRAVSRHAPWGLLLLEGMVDLAAGGAAFMVPELDLFLFGVLLGVWAMVSGAILAASGLQMEPRSGRWLLIASGLVSLVWGGLLLLVPATKLSDLIWWLGAYAEAFGILMVLLAVQLHATRTATDLP